MSVGAVALGAVLALVVALPVALLVVASYVGDVRGLWDAAGWWGVLVLVGTPALVAAGAFLTRRSYLPPPRD